jgi:hypothetical protein
MAHTSNEPKLFQLLKETLTDILIEMGHRPKLEPMSFASIALAGGYDTITMTYDNSVSPNRARILRQKLGIDVPCLVHID